MEKAQRTNFEENSNKTAKVAFVVWSAFDYYVYKNIVTYLPESEFVVCDTWFKSIKKGGGGANILNTIEILKKHHEYWRVITHLKLDDEKEAKIIESFFDRYDLVVGLRLWPPIASTLFNTWLFKKKSVLINYAAAKDLVNFAPWVAYFDIVLAEGQYTHKYFSLLSSSYIVGISRYDDWFSNALSQKDIEAVRLQLDPQKKTILYVPTHSAPSSLYKFNESIIELARDHNILFKLHYLHRYSDGEIIKKFENDESIIIFDERFDMSILLHVADVVISDTSAASLETILVDKPLIVLDTKEEENNASDERDFNGLWYSSGQYYSKSIEQEVKRAEKPVATVVEEQADLRSAVAEVSTKMEQYSKNRVELRKKIYSFNDGLCGKRAADKIRQFLNNEIKPHPPLIGMAIRAYLSSKSKDYQRRWHERSFELSQLKIELALAKKKLEVQTHERDWRDRSFS